MTIKQMVKNFRLIYHDPKLLIKARKRAFKKEWGQATVYTTDPRGRYGFGR